MTGKDIIGAVAIVTKVDQKIVSRVVQAYLGQIKKEVRYNQVSIKGFGTFAMRERPDGSKKPGFCPAKAWIEGRAEDVH